MACEECAGRGREDDSGRYHATPEPDARVGDTLDTPYGMLRVENIAQVRITQVAILAPQSTTAMDKDA
jgi:hypothetical protein